MYFGTNLNETYEICEVTPQISTCIVNIEKFAEENLVSIDVNGFRTAKNTLFNSSNLKIDLFSPEEFEKINSFKSLKRQVEWMCGRYAVKKLLASLELLKVNPPQIQISTYPKGAPYLEKFPDYHITISHSHNYAISALSLNKEIPLSIDMEKIEKREMKYLLNAGFTKRERDNFKDNDYKSIIRNWTIKEAYLKQLKLGFHESLEKVEVLENQLYYNKIPVNDLKIITKQRGNYMITLCYKDKCH
jgi:4'-phosphopantetheinyl transferase